MKHISLSEQEAEFIGTRFGYVPPDDCEDEYASNWRCPDSGVSAGDLPVLKSLEEKRLVWHMKASDWHFLEEDAWVLTDSGFGIFNWFHSFPENYGL